MTLEESYRILKLKPGATEQEVRRQFKRLALKVHPDINPDPAAHEQFIQLTRAMEIALNPSAYSIPLQTPESGSRATRNESPEQRKARMDEARKRYEQQQYRQAADDHHYFTSLISGKKWSIYKWVVRVGCLFAVLLILDGFLPYHYKTDRLLAHGTIDHRGIDHEKICLVQLRETGTYYARMDLAAWIYSYPEVQVAKSWFLHTPIYMYSSDDFAMYETPFDFHVGSIRWYLAVLLLVPLIPYTLRKKTLSFVFLYQFSFWGIGLVELYLLLTNDHLLHVMSLGFY